MTSTNAWLTGVSRTTLLSPDKRRYRTCGIRAQKQMPGNATYQDLSAICAPEVRWERLDAITCEPFSSFPGFRYQT